MKKIDCPICKGKGNIILPYKRKTDLIRIRHEIVKDLAKNGYSYRQIQKLVGFGSIRSVQVIVKNKKWH